MKTEPLLVKKTKNLDGTDWNFLSGKSCYPCRCFPGLPPT